MLLLIPAIAIGFYMAWNIGANDVANAMGTSVGSKALTFNRAVIIAGIFEFAGAVLVGGHVTNTVRKGIVDPSSFGSDPTLLVYGMWSRSHSMVRRSSCRSCRGGAGGAVDTGYRVIRVLDRRQLERSTGR